MKKLLLITDNFPFGVNEYTFILPELPELCKRFEVIIASVNCNDPQTIELPTNIKVLRVNANKSKYKLTGRICAFSDLAFYRECARVIDSKNRVTKKLLWCHSYYSVGEGFARELKSKLDEMNWKPDIIYTYWHMTPLYGVLRRKKWFGNPKVVTRAHGRDIYNFRNHLDYQAFKKESDMLADSTILACDCALKYYNEHFSVTDQKKNFVSYIGSDADVNSFAAHKKTSRLRLISCSNVNSVKRLHLIIDALSLIDDVDISWTHIGDGPLMDTITKYAEDKLCKDNIKYEFLGRMQNDKLKQLYKCGDHDCFITTTGTEGGVPISIVEAYAHGIPAIATAVGGVPEIVSNENGVLLSQNPSAEEIAEAIKKIAVLDEEKYSSICKNAYDCWKKDFVASENAARFAEKLLKMCE